MIQRVKTVSKFLLFLLFGLFLLWLTTKSFGKREINELQSLIKNADVTVVIICSITLLFSHLIRALRWKMMIDPLGKNPKTSNVFFAVLAGYFFNLLFPRLGEVMKCTFLSKYELVPVDKLIGTMVAERLVDMICLIVVILLTIFTQIDLVGNYANELVYALRLKFQFSTSTWLIVFISFSILFYLLIRLFQVSKNHPQLYKLKELIKGMAEGLLSIKKVKNFPLYLFYTISIWFCYLASIRIGFYGMENLSGLGWVPSLSILTFGSFAMIATQGGIGAYQLAIQKTLILYNINQVNGLAFGWLLWLVQTVILFFVGPLSVLLLYLLNKKGNKLT
ncbi:MAG: lysylphosphatidylglycerol synthase transmembrane domain-containing protein [Chitinophagaceae bacterium]